MHKRFSDVPIRHDLVLIGGGHSHLSVIRGFGMNPVAGIRVTVITRDVHTPYSGMLPGLIAGHYDYDEAHIDLRTLCQQSGARLIHATVTRIDTENRLIHCNNRAPIHYSWASLNIGSTPALGLIDGADSFGFAVKPVDRFLHRWLGLLDDLASNPRPYTLAIVGGGAAGVEVAMACEFRLRERSPESRRQCRIRLISASEAVPSGHNPLVQKRFAALLEQRGIDLSANTRVARAGDGELELERGRTMAVDEVIWTLPAQPPAWIADSGLTTDEAGFVLVDHSLSSLSDTRVFAAGDIASLPAPVPKSGVYAVREGAILHENLRRMVNDEPLIHYTPQRRFLSLVSTGDRHAIASRGWFTAAGRWVWNWKDRIDRSFMDMYRADPIAPPHEHGGEAMRCGGCAAKVGADSLARVMQQLSPLVHPDVHAGLDAPDDASAVKLSDGRLLLQSVDYFRSFIDDPYLVGKIAAVHCLSDIVATGALPHSALAIATIPHAQPSIMENTLHQLMSGALATLNNEGVSLIGGHSNEGTELAFGLTINGFCDAEDLLPKGGLLSGQKLILTKAVGSGTLFAANMACAARGRWIDSAIQSMTLSPAPAMKILRRFGATACTDVTGFGLLGHLLEMLRGAELGATLDTAMIPALPGALECLQRGYVSSLEPSNRLQLLSADAPRIQLEPSVESLLIDPQTAGGLLAGIAPGDAEACIAELRQAGFPDATIIGTVGDHEPGRVRLD